MMKLILSPGACSMSCHIAFEESGLPFEPLISTWEKGEYRSEIEKYNPQGAVPVLILEDGKTLTQNIAILNLIAERAPQAGLLPAAGTYERAQTFQWLSWVAADLHKAFGPLFDQSLPAEQRKEQVEEVAGLLKEVEQHLKGRKFLAGERFTVADAYLFTVYQWARFLGVPVDGYSELNAYSARIAERPAVRAVLKREGHLS